MAAPLPPSTPAGRAACGPRLPGEGGVSFQAAAGGRGLLRLLQPSPRPLRPPLGRGGMATLLGGVCRWYLDHPIQAKHAPLMLTVPPPLAQPAAEEDLPAPVDRPPMAGPRRRLLPPPSTPLGRAGCGPLYELLRRRGCAGGPPCGASGRPPLHRPSRRNCGVAPGRPPSNGGTAGPSVHA
jgi:hypothetical protein